MTQKQTVAINNPCIFAEETTNPLFKSYVKPAWSVILTVNSGFE